MAHSISAVSIGCREALGPSRRVYDYASDEDLGAAVEPVLSVFVADSADDVDAGFDSPSFGLDESGLALPLDE